MSTYSEECDERHGGRNDPHLLAKADQGWFRNRLPDFRNQRATTFIPRGVRKKDLKRCPTCGGLVKLPCLLCKLEGTK